MIRYVLIIVALVIYILFTALNLNNRCDISFGILGTVKDAPICLSVLVAFALGLVCSTPLILIHAKKAKKRGLLAAAKKVEKKSKKGKDDKDFEAQADQILAENLGNGNK
jgi:uncharacterized integral membrane protein